MVLNLHNCELFCYHDSSFESWVFSQYKPRLKYMENEAYA